MNADVIFDQIGTMLIALALLPWVVIPMLENRLNPQSKKGVPTATINLVGLFLALGGLSLLLNENNQARAITVALGATLGGLIACTPTFLAYKKPSILRRKLRLTIAAINWLANLGMAVMLFYVGMRQWLTAAAGMAAAATLYLFALKRRTIAKPV